MKPPNEVEYELLRAAALLERDPRSAAQAALQILRAAPANRTALLLLAQAQRAYGDWQAAVAQFSELVAAQPDDAAMHLELGRALRAAGRDAQALAALERAVALAPDLADAWRELSLLKDGAGDTVACDAAYAHYQALRPEGARLGEALTLLANQRYDAAERLLRGALKRSPEDVAVLRLLAQVAAARENYREAERLLNECLRIAPGYSRARLELVQMMHLQMRGEPMLPLLERLLASEPANPDYRTLQAVAYHLLGQTERSLEILAALADEFPGNEVVWLNYGHTLRTAGRGAQAIVAYRRCIELKPQFGGGWVALANLKTFRFSGADMAAMQQQLGNEKLPDGERSEFEFALGKALEDEGDFAASFRHYEHANALRRALVYHEPDSTTRFLERTRALYTREFFAARAGWGCPGADPIFIVGLPRSGSTLLEQILASHSQVEGTRELSDLTQLAVELGDREEEDRGTPPDYPRAVARLSRAELAALGERYLAQTRAQRLLSRARFIDKMGNNFRHVGLLHLMLPNARIIDARRAPLACCFANFKQHFHRGLWFSYSLEDLARYYRDYVSLMAHYDEVLPGRVYRVNYEDVVRDLEKQVRALLAHCGLPFEEQCLRFHETRRAVQTVSSEQVRRPLYSEGLEQWRNFEPWLGPLKQALGELAEDASAAQASGGAAVELKQRQ